MSRRIPAEKWAALRQLREEQPATFSRLGAASGIDRSSICERAGREGWKKPARRTGRRDGAETRAAVCDETLDLGATETALAELGSLESPEERLSWLNAHMGSALRSIAASGRGLTKPQIDALTALTRLIEKSETLAKERAVEKQTGSDAELAELLSRLDARIAELAEARAGWLVGRRDRTGDDAGSAAGGAGTPPF